MNIRKSRWKIALGAVLLLLLVYGVLNLSHSHVTGTIVEKNGVLLLSVDENTDNHPGNNLISVGGSRQSLSDFEIGDQVIVEYDGTIKETYPAQIEAISIRKAH